MNVSKVTTEWKMFLELDKPVEVKSYTNTVQVEKVEVVFRHDRPAHVQVFGVVPRGRPRWHGIPREETARLLAELGLTTPPKQDRDAMRADMIQAVADLLGPGYVSEFYENAAADFILVAESYAGEMP